jgi:hypothetical protein
MFFPGKIKWRNFFILIFSVSILSLGLYTSTYRIDAPFDISRDQLPNRIPHSEKPSIDRIVKAKIAYDIPGTMQVEKAVRAVVSITKSLNDSVLFQGLGPATFHSSDIKVSSRVKATMIDPTGEKKFSIVPLNSEEQFVDDSTNTIWRWNITPLVSGDNVLMLLVTVKIHDKFGESSKDVIVFERSIKVQTSLVVPVRNFISDHWQWLISVILLPLIVGGGKWGVNKYNERRRHRIQNPIGFKRKNDIKTD